MKIALFLGAGASVPYGMPTTKEIRDRIDHDYFFPRPDLMDARRFPNIENVLSVLDQLLSFAGSEAGRLYIDFTNDPPDREKHDKSALEFSADRLEKYLVDSEESKEIIEDLITASYKWNPSNNKDAEKILRPFFDLVKSEEGHVNIFTTNYDTVIEEYCGNPDRHMERIDGFKFHDARRALVWDGEFVPQNDAFSTKVILYKIHGSMNWLLDGSGGHRSILQKPDTGASDDRTRDMYIRPSLDSKGEATQKEPYASIFQKFVETLPSFDACIVIGYSFRDSHISEEFVKFMQSGKTLFLLSPTSMSDFAKNALKEDPPAGEKDKWSGTGDYYCRIFESGGTFGRVYALNDGLGTDNAGRIADVMRSLIKDSIPHRRTAEGT